MITNTRESMLDHESPEYIASRPDWVYGKIPDLSDYRKLSVDNFEEAFTLARLGQEMASGVIPNMHGKPTRLTFTQALIIGAAVIDRSHAEKLGLDFEKYRSVLMITPSRYGKLKHNDTPVLTINGWKKHGDLHAGDIIFHPSGKQIKVIAESPETDVTHKIVFSNGQEFLTHANHEWYVYDRTMMKSHRENGRQVVDARGGYRILETQEMIKRNYLQKEKGSTRPKYLVDPPEPCRFNKKNQPLDPYFVGCWLGDGTAKKPLLTLSPEKASAILPHLPYSTTSEYKQQGCIAYEFRWQGVLERIRELGLYNNKHIPGIYKYASFDQQKALLAGIIDTDGYVDRNGRVTISTASERLKDDIMELLTIMGLCPYNTPIEPTTSSSGIIGRHTVYNIGFQPSYELPLKFKKLTRIVPHRKIGIISIEPVKNKGKGKCIQVDSPDGLYLVGETLIPTHNSFLNAIACIIMAGGAGKEVQVGGATRDKAAIIQNKIVQMLPDTISAIQNGLVVTDEHETVNKKIQRLATQTSKESLMWQNGGSIKSFSTNEGNKNADVQSAGAIGIGGDYMVIDEIQLMSPVGFRTASRFMMEGPDTKRFCVGNPQVNGHFRDLYDDPSTFVIHANDITAIVEGRMTRKGFELTGIPTYSSEYRAFIETEFPDERSGTRFFSAIPDTYDDVKFKVPFSKMYFMGIDSAYQGADGITVTIISLNRDEDGNVYVILEHQVDVKQGIEVWEEGTTMDICLEILKIWEKYGVVAGCIDIGFGIHLYEKIKEIYPDLPLEPINFASKPTEIRVENDFNAKYAFNKRAEMHLDLKDLCESHKIYIRPEFYDELVREMREIGNTPELNKTKIEPKKKIRERLGRSPDFLDSLNLAVHAMVLSGAVSGQQELASEDLMEFVE